MPPATDTGWNRCPYSTDLDVDGAFDTIVQNARASVEKYLQTLHTAFIQPADEAPPSPSLTSLRDADIPTVTDEEFAESLAGLDERRRTLLGLVETDARDWPSTSDS